MNRAASTKELIPEANSVASTEQLQFEADEDDEPLLTSSCQRQTKWPHKPSSSLGPDKVAPLAQLQPEEVGRQFSSSQRPTRQHYQPGFRQAGLSSQIPDQNWTGGLSSLAPSWCRPGNPLQLKTLLCVWVSSIDNLILQICSELNAILPASSVTDVASFLCSGEDICLPLNFG